MPEILFPLTFHRQRKKTNIFLNINFPSLTVPIMALYEISILRLSLDMTISRSYKLTVVLM